MLIVELPTQDQRRWDGRDAKSHALIALSMKRSIIPHICSCKIAKEALDVLAELGLILVKDNIYSFDGDGKKTDLSASDILARLTKAGGATDE